MSKLKEITKELTISQKKELEKWNEIVKSGKSSQEIKKMLFDARFSFDPDYKIEKLAKEIRPKLLAGEKIDKKGREMVSQLSYDLGFENGISIMDVVEERYRGMMLELKRNMIKEYECKTHSEIALVDLVINAYSRNLTLSRYLINTNGLGHTTAIINNYLSIISKEIDRANRQFVMALETLKQFKQPDININVKTKNAFIAQNQSLVNNQNNQNEQNKPNEIIETK